MEFTQPKRSWLVRTTAADSFPPLDPESAAILQKSYAEMFEREAQQRKVDIAKDAEDDTDKYFRSIFDKQNAKARELESKAKESSKDA